MKSVENTYTVVRNDTNRKKKKKKKRGSKRRSSTTRRYLRAPCRLLALLTFVTFFLSFFFFCVVCFILLSRGGRVFFPALQEVVPRPLARVRRLRVRLQAFRVPHQLRCTGVVFLLRSLRQLLCLRRLRWGLVVIAVEVVADAVADHATTRYGSHRAEHARAATAVHRTLYVDVGDFRPAWRRRWWWVRS